MPWVQSPGIEKNINKLHWSSVLERKTDSQQGEYSITSDRKKSWVKDTNRLDLKKSGHTSFVKKITSSGAYLSNLWALSSIPA